MYRRLRLPHTEQLRRDSTGAPTRGLRIRRTALRQRCFSCVRRLCAAGLVGLLAGCEADHPQSALHPAGPAAAAIAQLWWWLFGICTAVFVVVLALTAMALVRRPSVDPTTPRPPLGDTAFIVLGGAAVPAVILIWLLILSLQTSLELHVPPGTGAPSPTASPEDRESVAGASEENGDRLPATLRAQSADGRNTVPGTARRASPATAGGAAPLPPVRVRVTGHEWWWEVRYLDHAIVTANEIHIPVGRPVRLELTTGDVIHSFWVPRLAGKMDMLPEQVTLLQIQADQPGVFGGQCAEYCGLQHAWMAFVVVALPEQEFDDWLAARQAGARETVPARADPDTLAARIIRGAQVFTEAGCSKCHVVRGRRAPEIGPDLTHLASRRTLGAGIIPNTRGNLMGWVSNAQAIKPGNRMPATYISGPDLHALTDYLLSLQ